MLQEAIHHDRKRLQTRQHIIHSERTYVPTVSLCLFHVICTQCVTPVTLTRNNKCGSVNVAETKKKKARE